VTSLFLFSLQYVLVTYSCTIILLEFGAMRLLKYARYSLRWLTIPCSQRWKTKRRIWQLMLSMRAARDYGSWLEAARELDELDGATAWRQQREAEYDYDLIAETTRRLRRARRHKDVHALILALRTTLDPRYGGIDNSALYHRAATGTKVIIEAFVKACAN
jgi:hypothetical protein